MARNAFLEAIRRLRAKRKQERQARATQKRQQRKKAQRHGGSTAKEPKTRTMSDEAKRRRIVSGKAQQEQAPSLLPQTLNELDVGQDWVAPLRVYIAACKQSGDVLLIDELHKMPCEVLEHLLLAMREFRINIVIDRGPYAKTISLDVKPFTLIGEAETTRKLEPKLLAAFHRTIEIRWTAEQLGQILALRAGKGKLKGEPEAFRIIAEAAVGNIGQAVKMLTEAAMYAQVVGDGQITATLAAEALAMSGTGSRAQPSIPFATMLPGEGLEQAVSKTLEQRGFQVQNVRRSKDGGVDVLAVSDDPITGGRYIIQCKDWSHNVGVDTVRELLGTVVRENAVQGILVTTSSFTQEARAEAKGQRVRLIDGTDLKQLGKVPEGRRGVKGER